jgi:biotin carboxyl carrier protein
MKFNYSHREQDHSVDILPGSAGFRAQVGEGSHNLRVIQSEDGELLFELDGRQQSVHWAREGRRIWLHINGRTFELQKAIASTAGPGARHSAESILRAPMPGQLRELLVAEGDQVEQGQLLMLLEAMKMEIRIQAPYAALVTRVALQSGASVEKDQILVELESDEKKNENNKDA